MKPILKWTGGKSSEIPIIEKYMPKSFDSYVEPFLGGGALFFHLEKEYSYVNDFNSELITFYRILKTDNFYKLHDMLRIVDEERDAVENLNYANNIFSESTKVCHDEVFGQFLLKEYESKNKLMESIEQKNGRKLSDEEKIVFYKTTIYAALYYMYREAYNKSNESFYYWDDNLFVTKHVTLWFVMRELSYSGMFRFSKTGKFNVPYGGISYNKKRMRTKLLSMMEMRETKFYKNSTFCNIDYRSLLDMTIVNSKDNFVFLDPPYDTEFSQYNKEKDFDRSEQIKLANTVADIKGKFMMVIKNTDFIYNSYKQYNIVSFDKTYSVNFKNRNNQAVEHLIITNY